MTEQLLKYTKMWLMCLCLCIIPIQVNMFLDRIAECEKAIQIAAFYAHYIRPSCLPYHTI